MPKYTVLINIMGWARVAVEAEDEDDAQDQFEERQWDLEDFDKVDIDFEFCTAEGPEEPTEEP